MQVFESGPERVPTLTDTEMNGVPVDPRALASVACPVDVS